MFTLVTIHCAIDIRKVRGVSLSYSAPVPIRNLLLNSHASFIASASKQSAQLGSPLIIRHASSTKHKHRAWHGIPVPFIVHIS